MMSCENKNSSSQSGRNWHPFEVFEMFYWAKVGEFVEKLSKAFVLPVVPSKIRPT